METKVLFVSLLLIILGFLVKSFPNLIAGYNTLSSSEKENVDIEGLSSFMRNGLIAIGLSISASFYLFIWMNLEVIAHSMILICPVLGVAILVVFAQRYKNKKADK